MREINWCYEFHAKWPVQPYSLKLILTARNLRAYFLKDISNCIKGSSLASLILLILLCATITLHIQAWADLSGPPPPAPRNLGVALRLKQQVLDLREFSLGATEPALPWRNKAGVGLTSFL